MVVQRWDFFMWITVLLYRVRFSTGSVDTKTWIANTNFDDGRNWDTGQLPCANDRVVFPASLPVITFMPKAFSVAEIILPMDGQLIFPQNASITITGGKSDTSCPSKTVHYIVRSDLWYNPVNWNITSPRAIPTYPSRKNAAVPHAFQVPCRTDGVVFPQGMSFNSLVSEPTVVASLEINGKSFENEEFQGLLESPTGQLLFPNRPVIHITGIECNNPSGCLCGNDHPSVLPKICHYQLSCQPVHCADPIQPVGHCCPICGAWIVMQPETSFRMDLLIEFHKKTMEGAKYIGIECFTMKTYKEDIQTIFVDGTQRRGSANELADSIYDALINDINHEKLHKIRSAQIYKSEKWNPEDNKNQQFTSQGMSPGGVAAVVIIIIAIGGSLLAFYIYKKRYIPGFSFARFDLYSGKIELELGTTPHDELEPEESPKPPSREEKDNAFENPIYGSEVATAMPNLEESVEEKNYVENPMFMIFEKTDERNKN